jgi:hypothetical protein
MATYVLMCVAKTGSTTAEQEGEFDSVTWLSPGNTATMPNPATAALTGVQDGDEIGFAVKVVDGNNAVKTQGQLNWVSVSVSAVTQAGDRTIRYADNDSPFRIGSGNRPNTMLLASSSGSPAGMQDYNDVGQPVTAGTGTYRGLPLLRVWKDVPPGRSTPARPTSQYEAVIGCSVTDSSGVMWQYTFDPEVDVQNGN